MSRLWLRDTEGGTSLFSDPPFTGQPTQPAIDALAGVVGLLNAASLRTNEILIETPSVGAFHTLHASELFLLVCDAEELLDDLVATDYPEPVATEPVALLRAAEALLRTEPLPAFPPGTHALIPRIIRLLGDAEHLAHDR